MNKSFKYEYKRERGRNILTVSNLKAEQPSMKLVSPFFAKFLSILQFISSFSFLSNHGNCFYNFINVLELTFLSEGFESLSTSAP